jgi:RNA polymerase sigma-70 factor (ECF subfamily)
MDSANLSFENFANVLDSQCDPGLVLAARAGSDAVFAELHRVYARRLYRTIFSITKNHEDTEDVLQETLMRAYVARNSFEGRSKLYSWLTRIAINSALMNLRKRRVRPEVLFDHQPEDRSEAIAFEVKDSGPNPEEICVLRQRQHRTLSALGHLSPDLRVPLRMQITRGWSIREISRALEISEAAVKSRLYRARQQLSNSQGGQCVARSSTGLNIPTRIDR